MALPLLVAAQGAFAQEPPALPRLAGIVSGPAVRVAIFEEAGGQFLSLEEGDRLGSYVVRLIRQDGVRMDGDGRSVVLLPAPRDGPSQQAPVDNGGATFGLVVNPPAPAPD